MLLDLDFQKVRFLACTNNRLAVTFPCLAAAPEINVYGPFVTSLWAYRHG